MSDDNPLMCCCCRAAHQHIIEEKDAEIARLLSYREQEVLKSADDLFKKCGLNQHAVVVRELLERLGGGR